jgi:hypothetical protein
MMFELFFAVFAYSFASVILLSIVSLLLRMIWNLPLRIYEKATGKILPRWVIRVSNTLELSDPCHWIAVFIVFLSNRLFK